MTPIKTYGNRVEAELASIALQAEGIGTTIVGIGVAMEGGSDGVRLLVPDHQVAAAMAVLGDS